MTLDDKLLMPAESDGDAGSMLFCDIVERRVAESPNKPIVIDGSRILSRADLYRDARRLGSGLRRLGLEKGAVVAFQLPNWHEACVLNLACALYGYVVVPLLTAYRETELAMILQQTGAQIIFIPDQFNKTDFPALIDRVQPKLDALLHIVVVRGGTVRHDDYQALMDVEPELLPVDPAPPESRKLILFTSGSTGRPKGVVHTHASVQSLVALCGDFWRFSDDERLLVASPIGHIGGSIYAFEFPWIWGGTAVLMDKWDANRALEVLTREDATFFAGATPFLASLLDVALAEGNALPALRRFICGGASVPPDLIDRAASQFANCVVARAYGSSEMPLLCAGIISRDEAGLGAHTDGRLTADVLIVGGDGLPVPTGQSGAILARGRQLFSGYLDPADDIDAFTDNGYFKMGDLGRIVEENYIEIVGREKELIIRNGENISPLEVETALLRHVDVVRAAVIGIPHARTGETAVAFVETRDGEPFDLASMREHLDVIGLSRFKYPERVFRVDEMPVSSVGKIVKSDLRARALQYVEDQET